MEKADILVVGASQVVTPRGETALKGGDMRNLNVTSGTAIAVRDRMIAAVGPEKELLKRFDAEQVLNCKGGCVTPGLVDCHTHLVFAGSRHEEFAMRAAGKGYVEIAKGGGGILSTVRATREADENTLLEEGWERLISALSCGTTTLEIKSGYGLDLENEMKLLRVVKTMEEEHPADIVATFMGAHEVPPEYKDRRGEYIELVTDQMLPKVAEEQLAGFCDVFCEAHVFSLDEARKVLERAKSLGFGLKVHADEIESMGAAEMAVEMGAVSASHLVRVSDAGVRALADSDTVAVLLPVTSLYLKQDYAPARRMIDAGCAVAVATDCNPGSAYCENMQVAMTLACLYLGMTAEEALVAATLNGAAAIRHAHLVGSLEEGKAGDIVVWRCRDYREIPYHFGINQVRAVVKGGQLVLER